MPTYEQLLKRAKPKAKIVKKKTSTKPKAKVVNKKTASNKAKAKVVKKKTTTPKAKIAKKKTGYAKPKVLKKGVQKEMDLVFLNLLPEDAHTVISEARKMMRKLGISVTDYDFKTPFVSAFGPDMILPFAKNHKVNLKKLEQFATETWSKFSIVAPSREFVKQRAKIIRKKTSTSPKAKIAKKKTL